MQWRRARTWSVVTTLLFAVLGPVAAPAGAAAGAGVDPSFGREGIYRLDLTEPSLDVAHAAVLGSAGLIGAGSAGGRFALAGFDFGSTYFNYVYQELIVGFAKPSAAHALTQVNGRLIAVGSVGDDFAVAGLLENGDPDLRFGDVGKVSTSFGAPATAYAVTPITDQRTAVVGTVHSGAGSSLAMARYDARGRLDPTFGVGGKIVVDVTPGADSANAVAGVFSHFEGDRIVVAGRAGPDVLLARFLADGSPDPAFGTGGRVVLDLSPGDDVANALHLGTDGRIYVAGSAGTDAFVARFSLTGQLDAGFGAGGIVRSAMGGTSARLRVAFWDPSMDKLVVAGTVTGAAGDNAVVARFEGDGAVDATFGAAGRSVVDLGGRADQGNAMVVDGGAMRVVGTDGADMVSATMKRSDGSSPYAGYQPQKVDFGGPTDEEAGGITVLPDGKMLVAGWGTRGIILARLLADGSPDPSFGTGGVSITPIFAKVKAVATSDGRILVLGYRDWLAGGTGVFRFTADGKLDATYGDHGFAVSGIEIAWEASAMAVLPGGSVVVGAGGRVVKLSPAGAIESSFYLGGLAEVVGLAAQPDGKFVALDRNSRDRIGAGLRRFNGDGSLDDTFHNSTWLTSIPVKADPSALLRLSDGRFAVGGRTATLPNEPPETVPDLVLAGFTPQGALDKTFGTGGATRVPVADFHRVVALEQQADGRIVSLHGPDPRSAGDVAGLTRYLPDGRLDTSFGIDGVAPVTGIHPTSTDLTAGGQVLVAGRTTIPWDLAVVRARPADGSAPTAYHPLTPSRLLDTRSGLGAPAAKLSAGATVALQVTGRGGVPSSGVSAVVLNVTATAPTDVSFLTAWPAGHARPLASNLNVAAGQTVANLVVVRVGVGGRVNLYNNAGSTDLVADVAGWYGTGGTGGAGYSTVTPNRILDTRSGLGAPAAPVGAGSAVGLQVTGRGGVPVTGVSAVVMNITATDATAVSYLTAWPGGATRPLASNLNYSAGQTVPNLVMVKVGAGGVVNLFNNSGSVHLIADVAGWYGVDGGGGGARFSSVVPSRILDTRSGLGAAQGKVGPGSRLDLQVTGRGGVPASGVTAVVMNVTVTEPTSLSFLTVWPAAEARPLASNLNYVAGQTVPNLVVVKVGEGGRVNLYNNGGAAHVLADVAGWYG